MFLVTTANQNFWKTDEKIIFLGEWCKIYDQKHIWSKFDHETLPSHWDKLDNLEWRYKYLESISEKYLNSFVSSLNDIHDQNHSIRYWRIILGPWLNLFVQNIYDKYLSIKSCVDSKKITNTWIPPLKPERWVPKDSINFEKQVSENINFNLYLYGRIISTVGKIPFEYKHDKSISDLLDIPDFELFNLSSNTNSFFNNLLIRISQRIPNRFKQIVFSASGLSFKNLFMLQCSLGQIPFLSLPKINSCRLPVNDSLRKRLKLPQECNEFETILNQLIVEQLPTCFLEGYSAMKNKSLNAFPKDPKVIITSNNFGFDESFKIWVATKVEQGVKFIIVQHGGGYSLHGTLQTENHELQICDKYFVWGWVKKEQSKVIPISGGKLCGPIKNSTPDSKGAILYVASSWPLFFVNIDHIRTGFDLPNYYLKQAGFLSSLCPEALKILLVRFPRRKDSWDGAQRLNDIYPSIEIYKGKSPIFRQLRKSRLCLHDYLGTSWLETLSMNFPTVVIWDPARIKIIESAVSYLDGLRRVKILHDSPESAGEFVNKIYKDPTSWWLTPELQQARETFCNQFSRTSKHWLKEWKEKLLGIVK